MTSPDPAAGYAAEPAPASAPTVEQAVAATAVAAIAASLAGMLVLPGFRWGANRAQRRAMLASPSAQTIVATLGTVGVTPRVGRAVLAMTLTHSPIPRTTKPAAENTATRAMQTVNLTRRSAYIVNASVRVQRDVDQKAAARDSGATVVPRGQRTPSPGPRPIVVPRPEGRAPSPVPTIPGLPPGTQIDPLPGDDDGARISRELEEALRHERRFWELHKKEQQKRDLASRSLDEMAAKYGDTVGWHARKDSQGRFKRGVSPMCKKADGRNFQASRWPAFGIPGYVREHGGCLCSAGAPYNTKKTVYELG